MAYQHTDYRKYIEELIKRGHLQESEVYYLTNEKSDDDLRLNFNYAIWHLNEMRSEWGISETLYFFGSEDDVNAYADPSKEPFRIVILKNLIDVLEAEYFSERNSKEIRKLPSYSRVSELVDVEIERFMFQTICLFIYSHELGHINQFNHSDTKSQLRQNESYSIKPHEERYDRLSHLEEIDADWLASNQLGQQLLRIWDKQDPKKDRNTLEMLSAVSLASIFIFFLVVASGFTEVFYTTNSDHPHPLVRITYISSNFTKVFKANNVEVDEVKITNMALEIIDKIQSNVNAKYSYVELFNLHSQEIKQYIREHFADMMNIGFLNVNTVKN